MKGRLALAALCAAVVSSAGPVLAQKAPAKLVLLDVNAGQVPPETALDNQTTSAIVTDRKELGAKALKVAFAKGDSVCSRARLNQNWSRFATLRFDAFVSGDDEVELDFIVHHAGSTGQSTRVVVPLKLNSGKTEVSLDIDTLRNVNGSDPDLKAVERWVIADKA